MPSPRFGHSSVTPAERHTGQDRALLARRHALYQQARERNPRRWSGQTRNWTPIAAVTLNPERDAVVQATLLQSQSNKRSGEAA
jgi:putative transposase